MRASGKASGGTDTVGWRDIASGGQLHVVHNGEELPGKEDME